MAECKGCNRLVEEALLVWGFGPCCQGGMELEEEDFTG